MSTPESMREKMARNSCLHFFSERHVHAKEPHQLRFNLYLIAFKVVIACNKLFTRLLNQACAHSRHVPGFLKLFYEKCVCVCMYVCMYICLSFCTHVSKPFTWRACIQTIKAKQSLYYTHAQVSSALKVSFFPNWKLGMATVHRHPGWLS